MNDEVVNFAKAIVKEITEENKKNTEETIKIIKQITNEDRTEFFKRLERIVSDLKTILVVLFRCIAFVISVWIICYFFCPYLTRNYAKVENGTVIQQSEVSK
jgi:F0F1-type ATP synthase membrane subunit b/b'